MRLPSVRVWFFNMLILAVVFWRYARWTALQRNIFIRSSFRIFDRNPVLLNVAYRANLLYNISSPVPCVSSTLHAVRSSSMSVVFSLLLRGFCNASTAFRCTPARWTTSKLNPTGKNAFVRFFRTHPIISASTQVRRSRCGKFNTYHLEMVVEVTKCRQFWEILVAWYQICVQRW